MSGGYGRRARPSPPATLAIVVLVATAPVWVLILRHSVATLFQLGQVAPDLALAAVVAAAWTRSPFVAVCFALLLGAGLDLAGDTPWGLGPARLGALAALTCGLRQHLVLEDIPGGTVILVFGFALLERSLAALTLRLYVPEASMAILLPHALGIAFLTACLAPLAFGVAGRLTTDDGRRR